MSTVAQEEADRFFAQKEHHTAHPEDRVDPDNLSTHSLERENKQHSGQEDDEDTLHSNDDGMSTTAACYIPHTRFDANTGPKGVIADAQSFRRAKKSTFRKTLASFSNALSSKSAPSPARASNNGSESEESEDEEFMRQWRQNRLQELSEKHGVVARRQSPSKRTWGRVEDVDANGYLDAIERVKEDVVVVVCIYDPESTTSAEVEDGLDMIAYKHSTTRFVKMHHEIAEMSHVVIPALLAYRAGDLFATISDCRPEGLETTLRRNGILE